MILEWSKVKPIFDSWRGFNALIPYTVRSGCGARQKCGATDRYK